jgi:hypothetical protein
VTRQERREEVTKPQREEGEGPQAKYDIQDCEAWFLHGLDNIVSLF